MKLIKSLALSVVFSYTALSYAEFESGNKLKQGLEAWDRSDTSQIIDGALAVGYVKGVYDSRVRVNFCPPSSSSITVGQVISIVLKFLRENPDQLHKTGDTNVVVALMRVWPCAPRQQDATPDTSSPTPVPQAPKPRPKPREESSPF